jgi:L-seryl-tRNA(Ser) seleniumtransferase
VGANDGTLGTGGENTELWEIDAAIGEDTAAVAYMEKPYTTPDLEAVVEVAHDNGVPVIVDAAAELPPVENLSAFVDAGADLVVFSGGKAIRGPQTTGIVAGKAEYVESIALQNLDMHTDEAVWSPPPELIDADALAGVPRHGIGRGFKVGKEELVGLIYALREFVEADHDREMAEWRGRAERIESRLADVDALEAWIEPGGELNRAATVVVAFDEDAAPPARDVALALREEDPRVFVGSDDLSENRVTINPMCLSAEEADYVVDRIESHL